MKMASLSLGVGGVESTRSSGGKRWEQGAVLCPRGASACGEGRDATHRGIVIEELSHRSYGNSITHEQTKKETWY